MDEKLSALKAILRTISFKWHRSERKIESYILWLSKWRLTKKLLPLVRLCVRLFLCTCSTFLQPCLALITLICILHPKIRINPVLDCQAELFLDYILRSKSSEHLYSTYYSTRKGQYAQKTNWTIHLVYHFRNRKITFMCEILHTNRYIYTSCTIYKRWRKNVEKKKPMHVKAQPNQLLVCPWLIF